MRAVRIRLLCSSALICLSVVATSNKAIAQDAAPQPPAAVQDAPAAADTPAAAPPAAGSKSAPGGNTLPQVEVISADDKPKPPKKPAAKKQAQSKATKPVAAPVVAAEPVFDPEPSAQVTGQSNYDGVTNTTSTVTDYVAPTSTVGSKTDTPLKLTPQSVSVVGKEQIRDQGAQTLQETTRYVPGVFADPFGVDSRGDSSIIRGLPGSYFVDGLRTTYGYSQTTAPIEPYAMDRIEVLRGPASMLYGQAPTGGLINGASKLPSEVPYREIGVEYGSFDFKQVKLDMTGPLSQDGKWLYRIVGLAREADTQVDFVENDRLMLAPSLTYRPTNDTSITVLGNFRNDQSGSVQQFFPAIGTLTPNVNGQRVGFGTFAGEPGDYYDTEAQQATLLVDHKFSDDLKLHHASRYAHTQNAYDSTYAAIITPSRVTTINSALVGFIQTFVDPTLADNAQLLNGANLPFLNAGQSEVARARTLTFSDTEVFNTDTNLTGTFMTGDVSHKMLVGVDYMRFSSDLTRARDSVMIDNLLTPSGLTALGQGYFQLISLGSGYGGALQPTFDIYNPVYGQSNFLFGFGGLIDPNNIALEQQPHEQQTQTGIYVQDQIKWGAWAATLGLRQDWVKSEGYPDNPLTARNDGFPDESHEETTTRAALMYNFDFGFSPYVSYSTSFSPQPGQPVGGNIYASVFGLPTAPAGPLKGEQIEVGFKYQPAGAPFMIAAAMYDLTEENQIVQPDILFDAVQGATVGVRGFELSAVGKITPELKLIGSYSYTEATYEKYPELFPFASGISQYMRGRAVDGIPEHLASLWAIYTVQSGMLEGLSLGGGVRYVGEAESFGREPLSGQELHVKTPSYTLFDAMLSYETEDWRWQLTAQNLEDKLHVTSCSAYRGDCFIGQARTIITGFTYKF